MKKQGGGMKEHKEIGQREPNFAAPNWQHRKKERKKGICTGHIASWSDRKSETNSHARKNGVVKKESVVRNCASVSPFFSHIKREVGVWVVATRNMKNVLTLTTGEREREG